MKAMIEGNEAAEKGKVGGEYVRFFQSLGVDDAQKVVFLGRLLQEFYGVAAKLDTHLAQSGATLHVAVSRMCEADNPTDAPQHRWIRVIDRLGLFGDEDDHASRVINIGLSYAYRHKELNVVSEANAVRLRELRLLATTGDVGAAATTGEGATPSGSILVARRLAARTVGRDTVADAPSAANDKGGDGGGNRGLSAPDAGGEDPLGDGVDVPTGGVIIRGPPAGGAPPSTGVGAQAAGGVPPPSAQDAGMVQDGGVVVATRRSQEGAGWAAAGKGVVSGGAASVVEGGDQGADDVVKVVDVANSDGTKVVSAVQPAVTPNAAAVQCVTQVLEGLSGRDDLKEALQQLLNDSLLCLARLLGGASAGNSAGVLAADLELSWPGVRRFVSKWWPVWEVATDEPATLPPHGTLARKVHATRAALSSRWMIDVEMTAINPVLLRTTAMCRRYHKKDLLNHVRVMRIGPGMKYPVNVALATMLLVGTQEEHYCTVLADLASVGRPVVPTNAPILAAACHAFETDGLGAVEDVLPPSDAPTQVAADGAAEPSAAGLSSTTAAPPTANGDAAATPALTMQQRYEEMDRLLNEEKVVTTGASRAHRAAVRRKARAPSVPPSAAQEAPAGADDSVAPPPPGTAGPDHERDTPAGKRRRVAPAPPIGGGAAACRPAGQRDGPGLDLISLCPPRRPPLPPSARTAPRRIRGSRAAVATVSGGQGAAGPAGGDGAGEAGDQGGGVHELDAQRSGGGSVPGSCRPGDSALPEGLTAPAMDGAVDPFMPPAQTVAPAATSSSPQACYPTASASPPSSVPSLSPGDSDLVQFSQLTALMGDVGDL